MRTYVLPTAGPSVFRGFGGEGDARNNSSGGVAPIGPVLSRPGWQGVMVGSSIDRAPGNTNDTLITRTRLYLWREPYYIPPAQAELSWTAAGPARSMPTTRFNRNIRPIVGGSNQEYEGAHTYLPTGQQGGNQLKGRKSMAPGKQNNLTVQRYRGQSYSATTKVIT